MLRSRTRPDPFADPAESSKRMPRFLLPLWCLCLAACGSTHEWTLTDPGQLTPEQRKLLVEAERHYRQGEPFAEQRQTIAADPVTAWWWTRMVVRDVFATARVVCATCSSAAGDDLDGERFDVVFCDEATQATEPVTLIAFLRATKVVLAGDHCQLPPTVLSRAAQEGGLGVSLFERMVASHGEARTMLREQHRMNDTLMRFPSERMYQGELRAHPSVAARTLADVLRDDATVDAPPLVFLDTSGRGWEEERAEGDASTRNPGEARCVVQRLTELLAAGLAPDELAVITPYAAQASLLRELASEAGVAAAVEIDTVDAFQGREKDAVLVSLVRSNGDGQIGFLKDLRRMNVAITRARRHLFVVGDAATLSSDAYYSAFMAYAERCDGYRSVWSWPGALDIP